jgi:hypothetical protein
MSREIPGFDPGLSGLNPDNFFDELFFCYPEGRDMSMGLSAFMDDEILVR